ncbi:MAG: BON domain-containing protein, partial [Acidobacteria bacterium]|nr:BON domain-containing protein [Acidobacteriota bacterium]
MGGQPDREGGHESEHEESEGQVFPDHYPDGLLTGRLDVWEWRIFQAPSFPFTGTGVASPSESTSRSRIFPSLCLAIHLFDTDDLDPQTAKAWALYTERVSPAQQRELKCSAAWTCRLEWFYLIEWIPVDSEVRPSPSPAAASPLLLSRCVSNQEGQRMRRILKAIPAVALMGMLTVACDRPADQPDYQSRVNDQLKTANLDDKVKVDWKNDERVLHLSGEVERAADKTRAEELASQIVGTSGRVVNEIEVEGRDYAEVD